MKATGQSSGRRFRRFRSGGASPSSAVRLGFWGALSSLRGPAFRRYMAGVRPHGWALARIFVLSLLGIGVDLIWPLASAYLIDAVILNPSLAVAEKVSRIIVISSGVLMLFAANSAVSWWRTLAITLLNARFSFDLRRQLFQRVLRLPLSELNEMTTGGILSRLSSDVDATTGLLQQTLVSPLLGALRLVVTLGVVFSLNARIAAALLFVIPPVMLMQTLHARRLRPIWRSLSQDRQDIDARVSEGLGGVRVVRSFRREKLEELAYAIGHHTVIRKQLLAARVQRTVASVWDLVMPLSQLLILGFGGYQVMLGRTSLGVLMAFQAYLWRLFEPISQIASSISGTQRGLASLDRVFEILDKAEEQPDQPGALPAPARVEEISFDRVSFEYRDGQPVLHEISLRVAGGTCTALVGPSGAGKTTLLDLLARFRSPTRGTIRINGMDAREYQLKSYRSLFGIVSQDVFLFDGSVADNIAYGGKHATREQIVDAARRANAHEFIERMPEGYDTTIGERGVKLSGGQRQRLSIARALLADPAILILDEATSNLDTESEQLIQQSLRALTARRTTFVIAHRLSTVAEADTIVVMQQGRALEIGSHTELMQRASLYRRMVERQSEWSVLSRRVGELPTFQPQEH